MKKKFLFNFYFGLFLFIFCNDTVSFGQTNPVFSMDKTILQEIIKKHRGKLVKNSLDEMSWKILGIAYHNLSILEVEGASEKAVQFLEKAQKKLLNDNEVLAFLGSAITMLGRDALLVFNKVSKVNQGVKLIDQAVKNEPHNISIRMIRANNSLQLPFFFEREKFIKSDFLLIASLIERNQVQIEGKIQAEVFYQLGMVFAKEDDDLLANRYFRKAFEISNDSDWGKKANQKLQKSSL